MVPNQRLKVLGMIAALALVSACVSTQADGPAQMMNPGPTYGKPSNENGLKLSTLFSSPRVRQAIDLIVKAMTNSEFWKNQASARPAAEMLNEAADIIAEEAPKILPEGEPILTAFLSTLRNLATAAATDWLQVEDAGEEFSKVDADLDSIFYEYS